MKRQRVCHAHAKRRRRCWRFDFEVADFVLILEKESRLLCRAVCRFLLGVLALLSPLLCGGRIPHRSGTAKTDFIDQHLL